MIKISSRKIEKLVTGVPNGLAPFISHYQANNNFIGLGLVWVRAMVLNATFNNISAVSWRS